MTHSALEMYERRVFCLLQAVVEVLDSCGNNIDEAIKLLGALQLSKANGSTAQPSDAREGSIKANTAESPQLDSSAQGTQTLLKGKSIVFIIFGKTQATASTLKMLQYWTAVLQHVMLHAYMYKMRILEELSALSAFELSPAVQGNPLKHPMLRLKKRFLRKHRQSGWRVWCSRWVAPEIWGKPGLEQPMSCALSNRLSCKPPTRSFSRVISGSIASNASLGQAAMSNIIITDSAF